MPRFAVITAFCLAVLLVSRVASADETTLIFATANPGDTHPNALFMHPWAQSLNADGKGVVQIDVRDGTAIANATNAYDRVLDDVVQIGWILQNDVAGKFPRSDVGTLPFMARSSAEGSTALWRLYQSGLLDAEYDTIHPLMLVAMTASGIHMSHPLKSLDSLGGAKLIVASKVNADAITLLGGSPLSIPLFEMYAAIQRGTADGAAVSWTSFNPFKLAEVTNYHVDTTLGTSVGMIFMSKRKYESLSPAVKKVLDAHSGEMASRAFGAFWDQERKDGKGQTVARGDKRTIVTLTPEQTAAWRQKMAPLEAAWVARTPDGAKVLAAYRTELSKLQTGM
ncbi:MAG TPA: TRAP transporter substrate-binding protein [Stellaceae bacterium]|jgi:TRAP-type C4-dicarboxylate transport system substrate-binding protein